MFYYKSIDIPNFKIIQKKVSRLFPNIFSRSTLLHYDKSTFLKIKELKDFLENLNLIDSIFVFSLHVTIKNEPEVIHIDEGEFNCSLNLPILNCNNTFVNFYETIELPKKGRLPNSNEDVVDYLEFDKKNCKLVNCLEMNKPHLINVKIPHGILNPNPTTRITLLIRLIKYEY